jgi:dolichol kinase
MREHEVDMKQKNLNGASYVFIGATLTLWIFPKIIFITAFTMLIICDIAAALIGRKFGKHKFLAKSLEGTLAFFVFSIIVVLFTPKINWLPFEYLIGIAGGAVGAIIENVSYGWADDNLTIPISIGLTMWGLYAWLLPYLTI